MDLSILAATVVLLPLLGSGLWFWVSKFGGEKAVSVGAVLVMTLSFLGTVYLFLNIQGQQVLHYFTWMQIGETKIAEFAFLLDPLSLALGLVVTGVGTLIHLYATGYMHGDSGFGRFFSYLNLFVFSMLMLIWSNSLVGLFLGWEGVGLCSYLLISFWFSEEANAYAGKKAFIVNRIGDLGFLVALFSLFKVFGTLNIPEILSFADAANLSSDQLFWSHVALFGFVIGAAGKSAQIPLFVWLPDAMAGPTPVSALIHAATMVTAGVYLACRMQGLFNVHPDVLEVVAYVGGLTAFLAATIAVFQNDIKKVLAYSTVSQLGYLFLAFGLAAPVAAYFHLMTHAFFKALLFLGAGSVIHGMHHEQDMRKMGGLRTQMPITFWAMTIGVLAIAGVPPLSGFVSKDEILHVVSHSHRPYLIFFGFAAAFLTAFYMGRLWLMTFFGEFRGKEKAHESPWTMTSVLVVLAILSAFGGLLNWPHVWGGSEWLHGYLGTVVAQAPNEASLVELLKSAGISVAIGLSGLALAWWKYRSYNEAKDFKGNVWSLFRNKYYLDEIYQALVVNPLFKIGGFLWKAVDQGLIDGVLNGSARWSNALSYRFRQLQTGMTQAYALWVWVGVLVLVFGAWSVR